jgi:transcriptional regulator with XRE-family HTH domain
VGAEREDLRLLVLLLRAFQGGNQAEAAGAAGLDRAALCRYEAGQVLPSRPTLERLARAAGIPTAVLDALLLPAVQSVRTARVATGSATAGDGGAAGRLDLPLRSAAGAGFALLLADPGLRGGAVAHEPRTTPDLHDLKVAVRFVRLVCGSSQAEMAAAAGIDRASFCRYEAGDVAPGRVALARLAAAAGLPVTLVDALLLPAIALARADRKGVPDETQPAAAAVAFSCAVSAAAAEALGPLLSLPGRRPSPRDRAVAAELWRRLARRAPGEWLRRLEGSRRFQSWAMAERLAHESERAAADRADLALELAQLGLRVAELAPGEPAWRSRCLGYCWGFVANARRVGDDLEGAEEAFREAWRLWRAGDGTDPDLLAEWRLLDREASLRRDQREFTAALDLLARARASAPAGEVPRILLNRAFTLEQAGRPEEALAELRAAAPLVEAMGHPRLRFALHFNVITNLCPLGRYEEAEELLRLVQELVVELGNELDLVRVLWLSGRVAGGRGRRQEARAKLGQALREFAARGKSYDTALVALELAVLLLEDGCRAEVRALAGELLWVFTDQGIHREALAALTLFRRAVEAETLSLEQARRFLAYLERARHDRRLRFEGA